MSRGAGDGRERIRLKVAECYKGAGWSWEGLWESEFRAENKRGPLYLRIQGEFTEETLRGPYSHFSSQMVKTAKQRVRAKAGGLRMCQGGCGVDSGHS